MSRGAGIDGPTPANPHGLPARGTMFTPRLASPAGAR